MTLKILKTIIEKTVSKVILALGLIVFSLIVSNYIFWPRISAYFSLYRDQRPYQLIVGLNLVVLVFILLGFSVLRFKGHRYLTQWQPSRRLVWAILTGELMLLGAGLFVIARLLDTANLVSDSYLTFQSLKTIEAGRSLGYGYMYSNPQNLLLMDLFDLMQKTIGFSTERAGVVFILLYLLTIIFMYATLAVLTGDRVASLMAVQILMIAIQVSLHTLLVYTDILTFPFVAASICLLAIYWRYSDQMVWYWQVSLLAGCGLFAGLGFLSKGTTLIVILAVFLSLGAMLRGRHRGMALIPLVMFVLVVSGWNGLVRSEGIFPDANFGQPNTHYLMMGMSATPIPSHLSLQEQYEYTVGAYSLRDQKYTWKLFLTEKLPKAEIEKRNLHVFRQRLGRMSLLELTAALNNKVATTWGSGDLQTSNYLSQAALDPAKVRTVFTRQRTGLPLYLWMTFAQLLLYGGILFGLWRGFAHRSPMMLFAVVMLLGYFFFLLIWEANPRYSMTAFVPGTLISGLGLHDWIRTKARFER